MTRVFRPILKESLMMLFRAPSLMLFGVVVAFFGVLREPLTAAGWPNIFTRAIVERWMTQEETTNALFRGTQLSWKTTTANLLRIVQTDTWGFIGLASVFLIAVVVLVLLLYLLPRAIAALTVAGRSFQTHEYYSMRRTWTGGRGAWRAVLLFIAVTQLIPWAIASLTGQPSLSFIVTFFLTAWMIYSVLYHVIGGYTVLEATRAGLMRLVTRLGTTIEFTILMLGTDILGIGFLTLLGAIAIVPFLLLLIILWALHWSLLSSWVLVFIFVLLILYTLGVFGALVSFNYLLWINLFYTCERIKQVSFTARAFSALRDRWNRRRNLSIAP